MANYRELKKKYQNDPVMLGFVSCEGDLDCINEKLHEAGNGSDFTLQEIADILGITRERVRQIESSAIKKLRHPKVGRSLNTYVHEHITDTPNGF